MFILRYRNGFVRFERLISTYLKAPIIGGHFSRVSIYHEPENSPIGHPSISFASPYPLCLHPASFAPLREVLTCIRRRSIVSDSENDYDNDFHK